MNVKSIFCFICLSFYVIHGQQVSHEVDHFGRRIQMDGFLLEWDQKTSKIWKNNVISWHWDAANTPEGLAGFFKSDKAVSCSTWTFTLTSEEDVEPVIMKIGRDTTSNTNQLYRFDQNLLDSTSLVVCEWLIPWERLGTDSLGHYAFILTGGSECADSLPPVLITGSKQKIQNVFSGTFIGRAVLIAILLIVYIVLSIRLRNRNRQKELLRQ